MLTGKVALITGAAGGFGQVLVPAFLQAGAKVAAIDVSAPGLRALTDRLPGHNDRLMPIVADIADYDACAHAVGQTIDTLGGAHILINNGALGLNAIREDCMTRPIDIDEISPQLWQQFVAVNFTGAWHMTRAVLPTLRAQRWGRIITVTTSFFTMLRGGFQPYGPTKAGLEAMAAAHASEFAASGITVNVVVPGGPSDTPMVPPQSGFKRDELIRPSVMAPPMLYLCSDHAGAITGNRYVASHWDAALPAAQAEAGCRAPIGWPDLAQNPVWPGGKPAR